MVNKTKYFLFIALLCLLTVNFICKKSPKQVDPDIVGISSERFERVVPLIEETIEKGDIPGAVLLVARKGKIVMREAFGHAQTVPEQKKMKPDMIFDLASITKPMATATSVMILLEQGKSRLLDRVKDFVPGFSRFFFEDSTRGENARIYHLLTHTSGLPPYFNADSLNKRYGYPCPLDSMVGFIGRLPKLNPPGGEFHYSCLGFIILTKIVKDISGMNIHQFSQKYLFEPLDLDNTGYIPQIAERKPDLNTKLIKKSMDKIVPTEVVDGKPFLGTVHDPLARLQGGISGNAGLFSNADDMFKFAQMLLNGGEYEDVRILSPLTVKKMTTVFAGTKEFGRGLGWDLSSDYSSNGGDLFPDGGFGHTGYTGTSLWLNPATETIIILLCNRVHPVDDGSVVRFRSLIANIVAGALVEE